MYIVHILTVHSTVCVILQHENFLMKIYNSKFHNLRYIYHAEKGRPVIYLYVYVYV